MAVEIVTSVSTLMARARAVGDARKSGDEQALVEAQAALDAYERAVDESDRIVW